MGKIFDAIDKQIIKPRVDSAESEGFMKADESIQSFSSQGAPKRYKRTGTYENSTTSTGVSGGNGNYHYSIYLNDSGYSTGTPEFPVFQEAQYNGSGILGKAGTWEKAENDVIESAKKNFT